MDSFLVLVAEVWNTGFLGINLGSLIAALSTMLLAFLLRGFIISVIIGYLTRLAEKNRIKN